MGNRLSDRAVNVAVRKTFRRTATGKKQSGANGYQPAINGHRARSQMDEDTPLLGGTPPAEPDHDERPFWRSFFLNKRYTPGTDSPNPLVRWSALTWNTFKVTLLSCTYARRTARVASLC